MPGIYLRVARDIGVGMTEPTYVVCSSYLILDHDGVGVIAHLGHLAIQMELALNLDSLSHHRRDPLET